MTMFPLPVSGNPRLHYYLHHRRGPLPEKWSLLFTLLLHSFYYLKNSPIWKLLPSPACTITPRHWLSLSSLALVRAEYWAEWHNMWLAIFNSLFVTGHLSPPTPGTRSGQTQLRVFHFLLTVRGCVIILESLNTAITDNFPDYVPISLVFAGPAVHWSRVVITAARCNPVKLWAAVTDYVFMTIWSLETLSAATVTNPPWLLIIPFDYQWLDEICQTNECYDYIRNLEVGDFPCVCWR